MAFIVRAVPCECLRRPASGSRRHRIGGDRLTRFWKRGWLLRADSWRVAPGSAPQTRRASSRRSATQMFEPAQRISCTMFMNTTIESETVARATLLQPMSTRMRSAFTGISGLVLPQAASTKLQRGPPKGPRWARPPLINYFLIPPFLRSSGVRSWLRQ